MIDVPSGTVTCLPSTLSVTVFSAFEADWKANHADLRLVALHQQVTAALDVFDDVVRVEVSLPWYLSALQDKIAGVLKRQSEKALQIGQG